MNPDDDFKAISNLADRLMELNQRAVAEYTPIVEEVIRSGSCDVERIEKTLDGLLNYCGSDSALTLFRRLCRHYYSIDPSASAFYVRAYREMWDSDSLPPDERLF